MAEPAGELPPLAAEPPAVPEPAAEPVAEPVLEPVAQPVVSFAAVFSIVTQRSSPQTAAHIRTTFLSTTLTNHHVVYIFRELGAPK